MSLRRWVWSQNQMSPLLDMVLMTSKQYRVESRMISPAEQDKASQSIASEPFLLGVAPIKKETESKDLTLQL